MMTRLAGASALALLLGAAVMPAQAAGTAKPQSSGLGFLATAGAAKDNSGAEAGTEEDTAEEDENAGEETTAEESEGQEQSEKDVAAQSGNLTDEQVNEVVRFVIGNATFILFHEGGHMLVSELGLPVLGREEDAVDTLSAILLLEGRDEALDKAITDSADGWFLSGEKMGEDEDYAFWDSHGLDEQRAYQIVCMMVGNDAAGFKEFADSIDFPESRREECTGEYAQARQSWFSLLTPHMVTDGRTSKISVTYQPPAKDEDKLAAEILRNAQVLENAAGMFGDLYKLDPGIRFVAKSCGTANAFWHGGEREVTFCYELAKFHLDLITEWFHKNPDG